MLGDGKSVDCRVPNKHSDGEKTFGYDCNLVFLKRERTLRQKRHGERFA